MRIRFRVKEWDEGMNEAVHPGLSFSNKAKCTVAPAKLPLPPRTPPNLTVSLPNYGQNPNTGRAGKGLPTGPAEPVSLTSRPSLCGAPRESHPAGARPIGRLAEIRGDWRLPEPIAVRARLWAPPTTERALSGPGK